MSRIVIGYEATAEGVDALRLGRLFAEAFHAEAIVATVLPFPSYLIPPEQVEAAVAAEPFRLFERAHAELGDRQIRTRVVADTSPALGLQLLAEETAADLMVIGACHRGAIGRVLLGSVGESILAGAPCPVAVAPRGYSPAANERPGRIGVAFDGSPEARSALALAIRLAASLGGELEVLSVAEFPHVEGRTSYSWLPGVEDLDVERREKGALLAAALREVPEGTAAVATLLEGRPGPALAEAAERVDLLVAGSRGYGAFRRALLGTATRSLLRRAPCPIVITPRGAAAALGSSPAGARPTAVGAGERATA